MDTTSNKRIVFITGDKGGVGKSFTARALVQYYIDHQIPFRAYDTDPVNPNLSQFYPDVTTSLNIEEEGALDTIRYDFDKHSLFVVDCAARSIRDLDLWFKEMNLFEQRTSLKLSFTFLFVVTPDKSCTFIMKDALERFGKVARYVVIKNMAKGNNFSLYDESKLRQAFLIEYGGQEILLPKLLERTVVNLDHYDLGFSAALNDNRIISPDRSRVFSFLSRAYAQFLSINNWLIPEEQS